MPRTAIAHAVCRGALCAALLGLAACATPAENDIVMAKAVRVADADRIGRLEAEIGRLRADLRHAEEALVSTESGLRGAQTRADAVSSLAEARIQLEKASRLAPWRTSALAEARDKLAESERQLGAGRFGSAIFFASRSSRSAALLIAEAAETSRRGAREIKGERVNVRGGPSTLHTVVTVLAARTPVFPEQESGEWVLVRTPKGRVGWVHRSLLRPAAVPASKAPTK